MKSRCLKQSQICIILNFLNRFTLQIRGNIKLTSLKCIGCLCRICDNLEDNFVKIWLSQPVISVLLQNCLLVKLERFQRERTCTN